MTKRAREIYEYTNCGNRQSLLEGIRRTLRTFESHIGAEEASNHIRLEDKRLTDLQDALQAMIDQKVQQAQAERALRPRQYSSSKE